MLDAIKLPSAITRKNDVKNKYINIEIYVKFFFFFVFSIQIVEGKEILYSTIK